MIEIINGVGYFLDFSTLSHQSDDEGRSIFLKQKTVIIALVLTTISANNYEEFMSNRFQI